MARPALDPVTETLWGPVKGCLVAASSSSATATATSHSPPPAPPPAPRAPLHPPPAPPLQQLREQFWGAAAKG